MGNFGIGFFFYVKYELCSNKKCVKTVISDVLGLTDRENIIYLVYKI